MGFTPDNLFLCVKLRFVLVIALKILKRVSRGTGLGSRECEGGAMGSLGPIGSRANWDPKNISSQDPKNVSSPDPRNMSSQDPRNMRFRCQQREV